MRRAAGFLSVLLHPVWMPTVLVVMAFRLDPFLAVRFGGDDRLLVLYGMVLTMTALFPIASTWMLLRSGAVTAWTIPLRAERTMVYLLTLLYTGMTYALLRRTTDHPITLGLFSGAILVLALVLLVNLRWKISAHMAGMGGVLGGLLGLMLVDRVQATALLCALLVGTGLLGSARLLITDHSPAQVYSGALLGMVVVGGCLVFRFWI